MFRELFGRLTPKEIYTLEELTEHLKTIFKTFVISQEESKKGVLHFHFYATTDIQLNQTVRQKLKGTKAKPYKMEVYLSQKDVVNKLKAIAYTIKEGDYKAIGIDPFTLINAQKISYKKIDYQEEVSKLKQQYQEGTITHKQVIHELTEIHKKCNKKIYEVHFVSTIKYILVHDKEYQKGFEERMYQFTKEYSLGTEEQIEYAEEP